MSLLDFSIADLAIAAEAIRGGSIREVARRHSLEPGTLSRLLKQIEIACGETLAVRSRNGIRPTESGRRLLTIVSAMVEQAGAFDAAGNNGADLRAPLLGIGAVQFVNTHVVAGSVASTFLKVERKPRIRLVDLQPDDLQSAALRGACDVCVHIAPLDWPKSWTTNEVGALNWRLYSKPSFKAKKGEPPNFIYPVYWSANGFVYGNDMHPIPLPRRALGVGVSSADAAVRVLLEGTGFVGFLPDVVVREHVRQGLLAPYPEMESQVVGQPVYVSVKPDAVAAKLYRALVDAIRRHLDA